MSIELQQPGQVISLATSALIVSVDVNVWTATKQDRTISDEITSAKNASADAGRFTKNLLNNSSEHKALLNYRQTVYNWLQRCTYDWAGSMRLLPVVNLEKFKKEYEAHEKAFSDLLDKFIAAYPALVSDAAFKQGDMFNRAEYPDADAPDGLRSRFRMKLFVTQVPANDFRSSISGVIAEDLRAGYERQVSEILDAAMQDAAERLVTFAERISNACTEVTPDSDGKSKRKKIYDTTITQAKELCLTLKSFNLTNNAELEAARARLEGALDGVTCEELRESSYTRSVVKGDVDDLLAKFQPLRGFA